VTGEVHIFDFFKHPTKPANAYEVKEPQLKLIGHEREGYGLCWSKAKEGLLISGSDDGTICAWDIN
jgi:histone-binding protein RBBP4